MISISAKPKRFVATLTKFRWVRGSSPETSSFQTTDRSQSITTGSACIATQTHHHRYHHHHHHEQHAAAGNLSSTRRQNYSSSAVCASSNALAEEVLDERPSDIDKHGLNALLKSSTSPVSVEKSSQRPLVLEGPRQANWWTGKAPRECAGYDPTDNRVYSLPQITFGSNANLTRERIQAYFDNTWTLTEALLGSLQGESAFMRPPYHELRHPMIFYYGHPAALYVNKLRVAGLVDKPVNPYYEVIFETGVDEMSWDDLSKNQMPWPSVAEVHAYRAQVHRLVSDVIANISDAELQAGVNMESPLWALFMAFEHERIHLETSSVLISEMPVAFTRFPDHFPAYHPAVKRALRSPTAASAVRSPQAGVHYPVNEMIKVPAQEVTLGKPQDFPSFGWDNEYGCRTYQVPAFEAAKYKTTNGEFYEFVSDGGYAKPEYWSEAGWKWRAFRNAKWPSFWVRDGPQGLNQFKLRVLFDEAPMVWDLPVAVNFHEAAAYAKWKAAKTGRPHLRVITEPEHHALRGSEQQLQAADLSPDVDPSSLVPRDLVVREGAQGRNLASKVGVNFNLVHSSMSPVNAMPPNEKGFSDVFGNAWEWTSDYFSALPGFEVHRFYEDFSTPCFDGLHNVIMGGSFISTGNEASMFARFHFRPHFFQHASFRLVDQRPETTVHSDQDAPGPFVGAYPFRRSQAGRDAADAEAQQEGANVVMAKNFGALSPAFNSSPLLNHSPTNVIRDIVRAAAAKCGVELSAANVLDVGCSRGGVSFALAPECRFVMGVDHSMANVEAAKALLNGQEAVYSLKGEGDLRRDFQVAVAAPTPLTSSSSSSSSSLEFRCSDPMCLPAELSGFDVVLLNDVLDKVSSPGSVLGRLGGARGLIRHGGVLVVLSAFDWKDSTTPRSLWLGGKDETPVDAMRKRLEPDFVLVGSDDVPLFWQESLRDVRGKLFNATAWRRV